MDPLDPLENHHNEELPPLETRRRLLIVQRIFFTVAIALSIVSGGGMLRAGLYHVLDNRAFAAAAALPPTPATASAPAKASHAGPLARLDIPRIGLSVVVLEGTDAWTLNRAVGHIHGTSYPGTAGNIGIAGHRDGYFKALREVHPQDEILLTSPDGSVQRYFVDQARIVQPDDVSVLAAGKRPSITLVTCYPFSYVGAAPKRYILTASRAPAPNEGREGPSS